MQKLQEKDKEANHKIEHGELPWIPREVKADLIELGDNEKRALKFIKLIQTHPKYENGARNKKEQLEKAARIGIEIIRQLNKDYPVKHQMLSQFTALVLALDKSRPELRLHLLDGSMEVSEFTQLTEKDLQSKAQRERVEEILKYEMAAKRTDQVLEDQMKNNKSKSLYTCIKCKGSHVTMYTQQTRSADEPMTEFYNCQDCSKQWRICP